MQKLIFISWKECIFNKDYKISSYGHVKNKKGKLLNGKINRGGYHTVAITVNGKTKHFMRHRLVAIHFIPNDDLVNKIQINHKDFDKSNNHISNLEWMTADENLHHARMHDKLSYKGSENPNASMNDDTVRHICEMLQQGYHYDIIEKQMNVKRKQIIKIKNRESWRHISDNYNWNTEMMTKGRFKFLRNKIIDMLDGYNNIEIRDKLNENSNYDKTLLIEYIGKLRRDRGKVQRLLCRT